MLHLGIYIFKFQFKDIFEKLNSTGLCGYMNCYYYGYNVFIHNSSETLINDLDTAPFVEVGFGETIFAKISKKNLDSIATEKNPCNDDDKKLTGYECLSNEVVY